MTCSACKGMWHPATGSELSSSVRLCHSYTLDWIKWIKRREAQMSHPNKGLSVSFTDEALTSIGRRVS